MYVPVPLVTLLFGGVADARVVHTSRDKILLEGDESGDDEDGDEDEVFALKGMPEDNSSEDEEDGDDGAAGEGRADREGSAGCGRMIYTPPAIFVECSMTFDASRPHPALLPLISIAAGRPRVSTTSAGIYSEARA